MPATTRAGCDRTRNLLFFTTPEFWGQRPFLPLVRRTPGREEESGLPCDVRILRGPTGFAAAVIACDLFLVPPGPGELLAPPEEVYDLPEEVYAAGWRVDRSFTLPRTNAGCLVIERSGGHHRRSVPLQGGGVLGGGPRRHEEGGA